MTRTTMQYKLPASLRGLMISALAASIVSAPLAVSAQGRGRGGSDHGSDRGSDHGSDRGSAPQRDPGSRSESRSPSRGDSSVRTESHSWSRGDSGRTESPSYGGGHSYSYSRQDRYTPRDGGQGSYGRGDVNRGGTDPFVHDRSYGYSRGPQDTARPQDSNRSRESFRTQDTSPSRDSYRSQGTYRRDPVQRGAGDTVGNRRGTQESRADTLRRPDATSRIGGERRLETGDRYGYRREGGAGPLRTRDLNTFSGRNQAQLLFSRSREGRTYNRGVSLRGGYYAPAYLRPYYHDFCYYPYYYPRYDSAFVFVSPYSFYFGIGFPFIERSHCFISRPATIWVDIPIYEGDYCRGWGYDRNDDYYLARDRYNFDPRDIEDPGLRDAIDDIREAFLQGNIETLTGLVDPSSHVAVFLKGKYDYSLPANDYLDMTRDALRNLDTVEFRIQRVSRKAIGVYTVSGMHVYKDKDGSNRTVYVSFVLEKMHDRWVLTQVGSAPDHIQEW